MENPYFQFPIIMWFKMSSKLFLWKIEWSYFKRKQPVLLFEVAFKPQAIYTYI